MNKKKLMGLVTSLSLVGVIGIGATLAYFTDKASTENIITMGHVDIKLTENEVEKDSETGKWVQKGEDYITEDGLTFTDIYPGDVLPKNPTITVEDGSTDAYVRVEMKIETDDPDITSEDISILENQLRASILDARPWYFDGTYYYYNTALSEGESATLFNEVTIPTAWKNNTADGTFSIKLEAQAIQAANFTPTKNSIGKITSWGNVDVEEYKK